MTVSAETNGFSLFAVTTGSGTDESTAETNDSSTETNESSTDGSATEAPELDATTESSDETVPGFGPGVSVLALLTAALLGTRRLKDS